MFMLAALPVGAGGRFTATSSTWVIARPCRNQITGISVAAAAWPGATTYRERCAATILILELDSDLCPVQAIHRPARGRSIFRWAGESITPIAPLMRGAMTR